MRRKKKKKLLLNVFFSNLKRKKKKLLLNVVPYVLFRHIHRHTHTHTDTHTHTHTQKLFNKKKLTKKQSYAKTSEERKKNKLLLPNFFF